MGKYLLKRILFFIPTLIIISLLAFVISIHAPGDPLSSIVSSEETGQNGGALSNTQSNERERWRTKLGLDLPVFYFSITSSAVPDTLYKIYNRQEHDALSHLIDEYGNWPMIAAYNQTVHDLINHLNAVRPDSNDFAQYGKKLTLDTASEFKFTALNLLNNYGEQIITNQLYALQRLTRQYSFLEPLSINVTNCIAASQKMQQTATPYKKYIPAIHFYGKNQYHRWIFGDGNWLTGKGYVNSKGLIRGDLGYSYETKLPVSGIIGDRIRWSLFFTLISILLAYLISLPIGLKAAAHKNSFFDKSSSVILFTLYSMPVFWVATLLLMTFANTDMLYIFPPSGIQPATGIPADAGWLETVRIRLPYLVLPTIAYTYSQFAFLSRITRVSTLEIIDQDFIRTARAKGLSERTVIYKHAFRNALLPIITVFSNVFPLAISGSVILETIFTIPGMGQQIYHAITFKDYPVIIDVFTLTGILTLIGYLIADILYALADPRITYDDKK